MGLLRMNVRHAARVLRRSPLLTVVAVVTLAVGIGANTAVFSVVNVVLLRPLPFPDPSRLVQVWEVDRENGTRNTISPLNARDWESDATVLRELGLYGYDNMIHTGDGEPEPLSGLRVTSGFFRTLSMPPLLGRTLLAADDVAGAAPVAVLSEGLWRRRFGGDAAVIGRIIELDGRAHTIVGVMPASFAFPHASVVVWTALQIDYATLERGRHYLFGVGRLQESLTLTQAQAGISAVAGRLSEQYPGTNRRSDVRLVPLRDEMTAEARPALLALLAAVGLVLLIACTNVANLLVSKAAGRGSEVAVRRALGAGRTQLMAQFFTEGAMLATLGGAGGLILALWGVDALVRISGGELSGVEGIGLDWRVLTFSAVLLASIALALGLAQALVFARFEAAPGLRDGARGSAGGRTRRRVRATLAAAQIALALPLLVGAALLLRTVSALRSVPPGFAPENVLTVRLELPDARYAELDRQIAYATRLVDGVGALQNVAAAGLTSDLPFSGSRSTTSFSIVGRPEPEAGSGPSADVRNVSPGYFDAMGIRLLRGRVFGPNDIAGAPPAVVINQTLARQFFAEGDALGQRLRTRAGEAEIIGIIEDVRHDDLRTDGPAELYLSLAQEPSQRLFLAVRTTADPAQSAAAVRRAVLEVDPQIPATNIRTMQERLASWLAPQRVTFRLLVTFALVAVTLASMGLYGVLSYAVTQRMRELGIRVALGASPREIHRLILGDGARVIVFGLLAGILGAIAIARALASLLFGVRPLDPISFAATAVLLAIIAVAACWLPARRATRADPMQVLRHE